MTEAIRRYDLPTPIMVQRMEDLHALHGGQPDQPHRHMYYAVVWVRDGSGLHVVDFEHQPVHPGTMLFISPGQVHQLDVQDPIGYVITFAEQLPMAEGDTAAFCRELALFFDCEPTAPLSVTEPVAIAQLDMLVRHLQRETQQPQAFGQEAGVAWLRLFLIACARIRLNQLPLQKQTPDAALRIVKTFKQLLEQHFRQWHKVSDYAEHMYLTPGHLQDTIQAATGRSAKEWIQNRLLLEARRLAMFSELTAKEAGYQLGFGDPAYFSRFLRQFSGKTFAQWRMS